MVLDLRLPEFDGKTEGVVRGRIGSKQTNLCSYTDILPPLKARNADASGIITLIFE